MNESIQSETNVITGASSGMGAGRYWPVNLPRVRFSRRTLAWAALAGLLSVTNGVTAASNDSHTKQDEIMKITRHNDPSTIEGPKDWFTGTAWVEPIISEPGAPSQVTAARVTFEAGARTVWHKHPLGQLLIVTDGVGWTQVEGEPKVEFQAGDVMACPKNKKHWHGATPNGPMTHIAVQEMLDGKNVEWLEPVTDAQYGD